MEESVSSIPEVVIMCGGYGSRMGDLAKSTQKCMLTYKGKPIMEHILEEALKHLGEFRPIFATSYREGDIREYFGEAWSGLPITYASHELGEESSRTITSLKGLLKNSEFFMVHGNILFDGSILSKMLTVQKQYQPLSTIAAAVKVEESSHNLIKLHESGEVADILLPHPGSGVLEELRGDGVEFNVYDDSLGFTTMRRQAYLRELGVNMYSKAIFGIVEAYPSSVEHNTWLYADYLRRGGALRGVQYEEDWIHFQDPSDLGR